MPIFASYYAESSAMLFKKAINHRPRRVILFCILSGMLLGALPVGAVTNPLHLSLTEANYDHTRSRLALTIRVQATDLEAALSAFAHRTISVADPGEFAPLALDYVREELQLKSAHGEPLRLEWAGFDVTSTQVFLFFETTLLGSPQGTRISNKLLHERFDDQINSVELHDGALKQTIVFAHDTGEVAVNAKP